MIAPRNRLLLWFAVVVLPFSLLGAVEPGALLLSGCAIGAFLLLAAVDAITARRELVGISVHLPEVVRMSKDRAVRLEIRLRNERQKPATLRLALALPREIQSSQEDAYVSLSRGTEWSRFNWTCCPHYRGSFRLNAVRIGINSRLGLWEFHKTLPVSCEIRVYPNLLADRRDLAALFLHRGALGMHAQRQIGKGREFEKLREYVPGDGFDEIHWKATARRGRPITKVFQIERTQEVYVVIDASRLSARRVEGTRLQATGPASATSGTINSPPVTSEMEPSTTLERFITASLLLGLAAEQQGDFFGLITFSDQVDRFLRAKNGKHHFSACRDALYQLEPKIVTPDYDEVATFIRLRLRRRALLIFLTALDDSVLAESFVRNIDLIRRQHLILVNMLPPKGVAPLFSDPSVTSVDDLYGHLGGHLLWHDLRELEKVLQRRGVRFSLLKNEHLASQLVSQYLNVKRRQML
ncbi:MAG TPA: DUF58 domain-containing protein [Clostridia bacterium]|nr:DUF58 domain-containing protein [Clostridia bacterium]